MKKFFTLIGIVACIAIIGLAFFGCKEEDSTPQEDTKPITAFGKEITVTRGDSVSVSDFNAAKVKLNEAMADLSENVTASTQRDKYDTMLARAGFAIIIGTGDNGPNADANKSMTIGVSYLLANDKMTIVTAISRKVAVDNAFAD